MRVRKLQQFLILEEPYAFKMYKANYVHLIEKKIVDQTKPF